MVSDDTKRILEGQQGNTNRGVASKDTAGIIYSMQTWRERVKARMKEINITQDDLTSILGVKTRGAVGHYLSGRNDPSPDQLTALARKLGMSLDELLLGSDEQEQGPQTIPIGIPILEWNDPADLPEGAYVFVPRYDVHVSAGNGHTVEAEPLHERPQAFRSEWVKRKRLQHNGLMCVYAKGDSMEPRINDGDSLLVDRNQKTVTDGRVYVLRFGDEVRVKRLFKRPDGGLIIRSDNTASYPDIVVTAEEMQHVEIIGRVVHVSGEM
jgi:phage repressor protein C with HTH and peptisase S24 domain